MAEKTIRHASFWYTTAGGVGKTALRGDTIDIERPEDVERGERHGAFASEEDLAEGAPLAAHIAARQAAAPPTPMIAEQPDTDPAEPTPAARRSGRKSDG